MPLVALFYYLFHNACFLYVIWWALYGTHSIVPLGHTKVYMVIYMYACLYMHVLPLPSKHSTILQQAFSLFIKSELSACTMSITRATSVHVRNSYGMGSTSSGSFLWVLTKCPDLGPTGCRLRFTFFPVSLATRRFSSFSLTRLRKSSRHRECFTCSIRMLIRFGMMRFLEKETLQSMVNRKPGC